MKIEYIYPDSQNEEDFKARLKRQEQQSTLGCLVMGLFMLGGLFIFLAILPTVLLVLGWSILFLSIYILYKAYLEEWVLSLIEKLRRR